MQALAQEPMPETLPLQLHRRLQRARTRSTVLRYPLWLPILWGLAGFAIAVLGAVPLVARTPQITYSRSLAASAAVTADAARFASSTPLTKASPVAAAAVVRRVPNVMNSEATMTNTPPMILSMTLLAVAPARAVAGLAVETASVGGQMNATWLPPEPDAAGVVPIATLNVVVPATGAAHLVANAGTFGHVLTAAGSSSSMASGSVRLVITVMQRQTPVAAPGPYAMLIASWRTFTGVAQNLAKDGLAAIPWAGLVGVGGAAAWGLRWWRQQRMP
jgi:hypothetical protein